MLLQMAKFHFYFFMVKENAAFLLFCCLVIKSCPTLVTPWTVAYQTHLSMGFSRQEYWSELPFPFPGDRLIPGNKPVSPALAGGFFISESPG